MLPTSLKRPGDDISANMPPSKQPKIAAQPSFLQVIFAGLANLDWKNTVPPITEGDTRLGNLRSIVNKIPEYAKECNQDCRFWSIISKCLTFTHHYADNNEKDQAKALCKTLTQQAPFFTVHFCNSKSSAIPEKIMEKLAAHSDYFKAICNAPLKEMESREINFADIDSDSMQRAMKYLVTPDSTKAIINYISFNLLWNWSEARQKTPEDQEKDQELPLPVSFTTAIVAARFQFSDFLRQFDQRLLDQLNYYKQKGSLLFKETEQISYQPYCLSSERSPLFPVEGALALFANIKTFLDTHAIHCPLFNEEVVNWIGHHMGQHLELVKAILRPNEIRQALNSWLSQPNQFCEIILMEFLTLKPLFAEHGINALKTKLTYHNEETTFEELLHSHLQKNLTGILRGGDRLSLPNLLEQMKTLEISKLSINKQINITQLTSLRTLTISFAWGRSLKFISDIAALPALQSLTLLPGGQQTVINQDLLALFKNQLSLQHLTVNRCCTLPADKILELLPQLRSVTTNSGTTHRVAPAAD